jgi:hypothetical protein
VEAAVFDEAAVKAGLAFGEGRLGRKLEPEIAGCDKSVRGYVASSARGRKHRGRGIPPEGPSIAAPARTERYLGRACLE